MKKKSITAILCGMAIVFLAGCGTGEVATEKAAEIQADMMQKAAPIEAAQQGDGSIRGSIKDLLGMGKALKCTWEDPAGMSGETYVDGKNTYSHLKNVPVGPAGEKGDSFVITDEMWMYTWSSLSNQGMKMSMIESDNVNGVDVPQIDTGAVDKKAVEEGFDMQEDYDYSCMPWVVDRAVFAPPADVTFVDMNAMMEQMKMPAAQDMAGICNMLTGDEKAACEAQMQ